MLETPSLSDRPEVETLKDTELRLISELMKDSRRSDRELATVLHVSQPTVSRIRERLEKEGYIREFTAIPDFQKLGFEIGAIILVSLKKTLTAAELGKARETSLKDMSENAPDEIILFSRGMGGGYSGVIISFHKKYSDLTRLLGRIRNYDFVDPMSILTFIVDFNEKVQYRYFTFSTIARYLLSMQEEEMPGSQKRPNNAHTEK